MRTLGEEEAVGGRGWYRNVSLLTKMHKIPMKLLTGLAKMPVDRDIWDANWTHKKLARSDICPTPVSHPHRLYLADDAASLQIRKRSFPSTGHHDGMR